MIRLAIEMKGWLIVISHVNGDMFTYHLECGLGDLATRKVLRPVKPVHYPRAMNVSRSPSF